MVWPRFGKNKIKKGFKDTDGEFEFIIFGGESTETDARKIAEIAKKKNYDAIIRSGGVTLLLLIMKQEHANVLVQLIIHGGVHSKSAYALAKLCNGLLLSYGAEYQDSVQWDEKEWNEIISFYKSVGLPIPFDNLGIKNISDEILMGIAEATCKVSMNAYNMPFEVNPKAILNALLSVNRLFG